MDILVCKLALDPNSIPTPSNPETPHTELNIQDTFLTLYDGLDYQFLSDTTLKYQMLQSLENNKPYLFNFQSQQLPSESKPNSEQLNIMTFFAKLADNWNHILSLSPVPNNLSSISFDYLINFCLQRRVELNERATWAIHHYYLQSGISKDNITKILMQIVPNDKHYFWILLRSLYKINLVNHVELLIWAIQNFEPDFFEFFKKDLVRTHSLLYSLIALHQQDFFQWFTRDLLLNQSHLIQLSIMSEFKKLNCQPEFNNQLFHLVKSDEGIYKRTNKIYRILLPIELGHSIDLSLLIPNLIFKSYPKYDLETISNDFQRVLKFCTNEITINICKCLLLCEKDKNNLSALIVYLIKKLKLPFRINEFTEFVYESIERDENSIHSLKILFYELQYQKVIKYNQFNKYLHKQGYFQTHKIATCSIINEFPVLIYDFELQKFIDMKFFGDALFDLNRFLDLTAIDQKLPEIYKNPINFKEEVKSWPYIIKFYLSLCMISKFDFDVLVDFFNAIDVDCLLPELSRKPLKFGLLNSERFSLVYEIHNIPNMNIEISTTNLIHIFDKFSYLCSLPVFDSISLIRSEDELIHLLSVFFEDLFCFKCETFSYFILFFECFCTSLRKKNSIQLFMYSFLIACFCTRKDHYEKIILLISKFAEYLFKNSIQKPHNFLFILFKILKKESKVGDSFNFDLFESKLELFERIFQIVSKKIHSCPVIYEISDLLSPELADSFDFVINQDSSIKTRIEKIYSNYLNSIKKLKMPHFFAKQQLSYLMAIYNLLPSELLSENDLDCINFFKNNVSLDTFWVWTSWMCDRIKIHPIFYKRKEMNETEQRNYFALFVNEISDQFLDHFEHNSGENFLKEIWWILCENNLFSKYVIQKAIDLNISNFDYLHPALLSIDSTDYENLCEKYRKIDPIENDLNTACYVFIIYFYRFRSNNHDLIINISNQLLEWLQKVEIQSIPLLIDTFNFIISWTSEPDNEIWLRDLEIDGSFQDMLHKSLYSNLIELPKEIRRKILLNRPKCSFKTIKKPSFYDLFLPEPADTSNQFHLLQQAFSETADPSYHNDFGFFDIDSLDWA